jgi:gliding motility-associated lipoprotein GldD
MEPLKSMRVLPVVICLLLLSACREDFTPRPRGYYRIEFPEKSYQHYQSGCSYTFDYPVYAGIEPDKDSNASPCWINVYYPAFNARIHLSYQPVTSQKMFNELVEDARTFAFKHVVKATAIDEARISYPENKVYGVFYTIDGNSASAAQFFLTDSSRHYLRGALYFNEQPQQDSIQPVIEFIKKDMDVLIKTFKWKK